MLGKTIFQINETFLFKIIFKAIVKFLMIREYESVEKWRIIITQSLFCNQASKVIKFSNYYGNSNRQVKVAAEG